MWSTISPNTFPQFHRPAMNNISSVALHYKVRKAIKSVSSDVQASPLSSRASSTQLGMATLHFFFFFFYTRLEVSTAPWGEFQCRRFEAALNVTPSRVHFRRASLGLLWYAWPKQPPRGYHAPCVERTFHVVHHKSLTTSEFYPLSRVQI